MECYSSIKAFMPMLSWCQLEKKTNSSYNLFDSMIGSSGP